MASILRMTARLKNTNLLNCNEIMRNISNNHYRYQRNTTSELTKCAIIVGGSFIAYTIAKKNSSTARTLSKRNRDQPIKLTSREQRFIEFSSVEFNGQLYMTPQDFLDSVIEPAARPRLKRRKLTTADIDNIKEITPSVKHGSSTLFRSLSDKGIISYTEYLFLLSILIKPQSGFKIAFDMFDTDGNKRIDKKEFLVMEKIFSYAWRGKRGIEMIEGEEGDDYVDDEAGLQRKHQVDTSLLIYFFGKKGNKLLNLKRFYRFMNNLQTEVLELEFNEFSKGRSNISEVDFANILLRYTYLNTDEYDMYLDRLLDRVPEPKGISFTEFHDFSQFLNNLEDFSIALRMYTLAGQSISKDEFLRAVKICTGLNISNHLVDTVFAIFDEDGDGLLSYREFIAIMRDKVHRGFKSTAKSEDWDAFRKCLKQELKSNVPYQRK